MKLSKKIFAVVIAVALIVTGLSLFAVSAEDNTVTVAAFNYDNTGKVADTDVTEYADSENDYLYLSTTGKATMTGSITGTNDKHLAWSKDAYSDSEGNLIGIAPAFSASNTNNWSADAYVAVNVSTIGYENLSLSLQLGATNKGPANYKFSAMSGDAIEELGTLSLTENKTMCTATAKIPQTLADKETVTIYVKLADTVSVGGTNLLEDPTGGEFAINNIVVTGTEKAQDQTGTSSQASESTAVSETTENTTVTTETGSTQNTTAIESSENTTASADTSESTMPTNAKVANDANMDGKFDVSDVTAVQKYIASFADVTIDPEVSDTNGDGKININDATCMQRILANLIPSESTTETSESTSATASSENTTGTQDPSESTAETTAETSVQTDPPTEQPTGTTEQPTTDGGIPKESDDIGGLF